MAAVFEFDYQKLSKYIEKAHQDIKTRARLGQVLSIPVYKDIMDHFSKEMGPTGKWEKWSISYASAINGRIAFRYINGRIVPIGPHTMEEWGIKPPRRPGKILQATGRLRQSFSPGNWRNLQDGYLYYNNATLRSGFPYAKAHDEGADKLPKRSFMWLSKKGMESIKTVALGWMKEIFE